MPLVTGSSASNSYHNLPVPFGYYTVTLLFYPSDNTPVLVTVRHTATISTPSTISTPRPTRIYCRADSLSSPTSFLPLSRISWSADFPTATTNTRRTIVRDSTNRHTAAITILHRTVTNMRWSVNSWRSTNQTSTRLCQATNRFRTFLMSFWEAMTTSRQ